MGLWANWPVALAPGMGLNAFFTFGVVFGMGYTFQQALAAVFVAGIVFIGLSVTPARKYIINSIPKSMKLGVGAGIGLFLAIIGFKNAGIVVDNPATLVGLGDISSWPVLLAGLPDTRSASGSVSPMLHRPQRKTQWCFQCTEAKPSQTKSHTYSYQAVTRSRQPPATSSLFTMILSSLAPITLVAHVFLKRTISLNIGPHNCLARPPPRL